MYCLIHTMSENSGEKEKHNFVIHNFLNLITSLNFSFFPAYSLKLTLLKDNLKILAEN